MVKPFVKIGLSKSVMSSWTITNVKLCFQLIDVFFGKPFHLMKPLKLFIFRGNKFNTTNNAHAFSSFIDIDTFKLNLQISGVLTSLDF